MKTLKSLLLYLILGLVAGWLLRAPVKATDASLMFGISSGVPKAITVDVNGNLNVTTP